MPSIPEHHAIRLQASRHTDNLMTHADPEDRLIPFLDRFAQHQSRFEAVAWISGAVGEGIRSTIDSGKKVWGVQFHPESAGGPLDTIEVSMSMSCPHSQALWKEFF